MQDRTPSVAPAMAAAEEAPLVEDELLKLLRDLPDAYPRAPRITKILEAASLCDFALLVDAAECAGAQAEDREAERKHRLCRAAAQVLLRSPMPGCGIAGRLGGVYNGQQLAAAAAQMRIPTTKTCL